MKKILVPLDFSEASENAAYYASALACRIGSNVELLYVSKSFENVKATSAVDLQHKNDSSLQLLSQKITALSERIAIKIRDSFEVLDFKPTIQGKITKGDVIAEISKHYKQEKMNLIVMGIFRASRLKRALFGSAINSAITDGQLPILLIPERLKFRKFDKMAFATDLNPTDIALICVLGDLAQKFNAELLVMHSSQPKEDEQGYQQRLDRFLSLVSGKVNYPKVYYRRAISNNIFDGLEYLLTVAKPDLLIMAHRHHSFWDNVLAGSTTKRMINHINMPLLVLPSAHQTPI